MNKEGCILCGKTIKEKVYEPNIGENKRLCNNCRKEFVQCKCCKEYFYLHEMAGGNVCRNCSEEINEIIISIAKQKGRQCE